MDVVTEILYNQLNQKSIVMEIKSILIGSELEKVTLKCENLKQAFVYVTVILINNGIKGILENTYFDKNVHASANKMIHQYFWSVLYCQYFYASAH